MKILGYEKTFTGREIQLPDAWSYSRLTDYETCPAKFAYKHVIKIEPATTPEALLRGQRVHTLAQQYVEGALDEEPPEELSKFAGMFRYLRDIHKNSPSQSFVEQKWAFTDKWSLTGWSAKPPRAAWMRAVCDYAVVYDDDKTAIVIDYKTGKAYDTNHDQVRIFSFCALLRFPHVSSVQARLWYLDDGKEIGDGMIPPVTRDEIPDIKKELSDRVWPMFNDRVFAPRPGSACRWCEFSANNGGPCKGV